MPSHFWKVTLKSAVETARDEVFDLADEMRQAFESTPEVFQATTGRPREIAADQLEWVYSELGDFDLSSILPDVEVGWLETRKKGRSHSRPARRDNISACLQSCVGALAQMNQDEYVVEQRKKLVDALDLLSGVFFPGMTGRRAA